MKKILLLFLSVFFVFMAFSQNVDEFQEKYGKGKMHYNEKGDVVFSSVVNIDSVGKDQIYRSIKMTITDMFNSANDVIQMDDPQSCTMIVKGFHEVPEKGILNQIQMAQVWFTMRLQSKDGRYRIDIYQIKGHTPKTVTSGVTIGPYDWPAEDMTYEAAFRRNGKMKMAREGFFRRAIIKGCNGLLDQIEIDVKNYLANDFLPVDENW